MPELPEVEATRRLVESHVKGDTVTHVHTKEGGGGPRHGLFDDIVVGEGVTEDQLVQSLIGRTVQSVGRKGKQLWIDFLPSRPSSVASGKAKSRKAARVADEGRGDDLISLLVHLGMTGSLIVRGVDSLKFVSHQHSKDDVWPPRFTKVLIHFASGVELAFADPRRLGRLLLRSNPIASPPVSLLAPDPTLGEGVTLDHATRVLGSTSAPMKAVLLDQQKLCCGIGNWVCDDVLLHAEIHPEAAANTLAPHQVRRLVDAIHTICRTACDVNADYAFFPRHWLFHERWGTGRKGQHTLGDGRVVMYSVVAGRSTVHIPALQKKGGAGSDPSPSTAAASRGSVTPKKEPDTATVSHGRVGKSKSKSKKVDVATPPRPKGVSATTGTILTKAPVKRVRGKVAGKTSMVVAKGKVGRVGTRATRSHKS